MRKYIYLYVLFLTLVSCQDVIEVETPTGEVRLNIDAHFRVYSEERITGKVILTETANFFEEEIPKVSGATVFVTDKTTGDVYEFLETGFGTGVYEAQDLGFLNDFETTFELTVVNNEDSHVAEANLIPTVPIDRIAQGDLQVFSDEDLELIVFITDTPNEVNYYLFDFGFDLYEPIDDRFFDGNTFEFSFLYTEDDEVDLQPGDVVTITNDGVDKQFYDYIELLLEQTQGGGPFATAPATVRGNFINTVDNANYALGYFRISGASALTFTIQER